jgi:hypothetical protein
MSMDDDQMIAEQMVLDAEQSGESDPLGDASQHPEEGEGGQQEGGSPFKSWMNGSKACMSYTCQGPDGEDIVITSCLDVGKLKEKLASDPSVMKKDPIGPLYLSKLAGIIAKRKLFETCVQKMERALKLWDRPVDFVMGETDYASYVKEGIPIALDVISAIYPGIGGALKTVVAANSGDQGAHTEIQATLDSAKQGDPQAKKQAGQLQQALLVLKQLDAQKDVGGSTDTVYSKKVDMGPPDRPHGSQGWYEQGL